MSTTIQNAVLFTKNNGEKFIKFEINTKIFLAKVKAESSNIFVVVYFYYKTQQIEYTLKKIQWEVERKLLDECHIIIPISASENTDGNFYCALEHQYIDKVLSVIEKFDISILKELVHDSEKFMKERIGKLREIYFILDSSKTKVLKRINKREIQSFKIKSILKDHEIQGLFKEVYLPFEIFAEVFSVEMSKKDKKSK